MKNKVRILRTNGKMKDFLKRNYGKEAIIKKLPYALLGGFTPSLMLFFFGVLDIFGGNRDEFLFSAGDFISYITLIALAVSAAASAVILFTPEKASALLFGGSVWLSVMGYVQVLFLNGSSSLGGDTGQKTETWLAVLDAAVWAVTGILIIIGAIVMLKKDVIKKIYLIALAAVLVMSIAGCAAHTGDITRERETDGESTAAGTETQAEETKAAVTSDEGEEAETFTAGTTAEAGNNNDPSKAYLTKEGLDKVSSGKNIIIFLIDRFDVSYYNDIISKEPGYFDGLDGFTYFSDNITLYSRTWPAVPTMITGIDNDFKSTASEYFEKAYTTSGFLRDLKENGYTIKLYTQSYYCYREGTPLIGVADNLSASKGYVITDRSALVKNLLKLSAYRYAPNAVKDTIDISSASFSGLVELKGDAPLFEINDPEVCGQILENGLSFDNDGNSYIFIHLNGCHSPYNMNAEAEADKEATSESQLRGCFKMIRFYLSELKRLGVYDESTIIITGDHPRARDDGKVPEQPRVTSLFVKPEGSTGELKYSAAQVSQENLIPTLVKSAGIRTDVDYGLSYFDIPEGEDRVRYHKFQLTVKPDSELVTFTVTGRGDDFGNWEITDRQQIKGSFYK